MKIFKLAIAAAAITASTAAFAGAQQTFTRDGYTYNYTTVEKDGAKVIRGVSSDGRPFNLRVVDGKVHGTFNGTHVVFAVKPVNGAELASAR